MKSIKFLPRLFEGLLFLILLVPFLLTVFLSFLEKGNLGSLFTEEMTFSGVHFLRVFSESSILNGLVTIRIALINSVVTVFLSYICVRELFKYPKNKQIPLLLVLLTPFFLNSIVRLLSLQSFVGLKGPLQEFIRLFYFDFSAISWSHHPVFMHMGFFLQSLPFALLPLYLAYGKWDVHQKEVAQDLGATPWQIFLIVEWPWMRGTVRLAFILVFIPSLGEYVVPEILLGSREMVWGQYITEALLKWRNPSLGAALGVIMMLVMAVLHALLSQQKRGKIV